MAWSRQMCLFVVVESVHAAAASAVAVVVAADAKLMGHLSA